jgi:hypothetical protein
MHTEAMPLKDALKDFKHNKWVTYSMNWMLFMSYQLQKNNKIKRLNKYNG